MRPPASSNLRFPLALLAAAAVSLAGATARGDAALLVDLTKPGSRIVRQLDQVEALVEEEQWTEAIELLEALLADSSAGVSVVSTGDGRYVSAAESCHAEIARLPRAGRRQYQATVDPAAKDLYDRGRAARDESLLRRVIAEAFCSNWGDDAARTLGDLALERGDFAAARRWWRLASPLLSDPGGRPLDWALKNVDLSQHAAEVLRRLRETPRPRATLSHPDSDVPLGDLLLRMVAASTREGDLDRAERELAILQALAPEAAGPVSGVDGTLVDLAAGMLEEARVRSEPNNEPNSDAVGPLVGRLWPKPTPLLRTRAAWQTVSRIGRPTSGAEFATPTPPLVQTATWGRCVLYRNGGALVAADLLDGSPQVTRRGELHRGAESVTSVPERGGVIRFGFARPQILRRRGDALFGEPPTVHRDIAYARVGPATATTRPAGKTRIVGRDLRRAALATLDIDPPDGDWAFGGPPLVRGGRLYVTLLASAVRPRLGVACYSAATGAELWRTDVLSGQPSDDMVSTTDAYPLLLAGDAVVLATDFGATAAVDAETGALRWVATEPAGEKPLSFGPRANTFGAVVASDRVFTASTATRTVAALDLATGVTLWRKPAPCDEAAPLGADGGVLVVAGTQIAGYDTQTGRRLYRFPGSEHAGLRGRGRGCLAGDEVFWPTRDRLYAFETKTGAMTRPPIDLTDLGGDGATVTPALSCLVVAGADAMTVLGPINRQNATEDPFAGPSLTD
ncbi:MAG: PQQ-binding-like beta-propeller repeat protein [Planctomycetota bacterium]